MIVKISASKLQPGMHVTNPGLSQESNPNIFLADRVIESKGDVASITHNGFVDAFVDTERGTYFQGNPRHKRELENPLSAISTDDSQGDASPGNFDRISGQLESAEKQYRLFLQHARDFINQLKLTQTIDVKSNEAFVESVIKQADEAGRALLFLSKLQQYDEYSYTHNLNVSILSVLFGKYLGLGPENLMILGLSGLFHDIGKLMVPERILKKPGKLTNSEFALVQKHPVYSREMLERQKDIPAEVIRCAHEHHEHYCGGGYPRGVGHEQIGRASSLVSIIDTYDAVTSDRRHRPAVSSHKAITLIFSLKGKSFSPALVDRFIRFVGIYPVGSVVVLANGRKGIVIEQNQENLLLPKIRVILDEKNRYCPPRDVDLLREQGKRGVAHVADCLGPQECRIHVESYLKGAA